MKSMVEPEQISLDVNGDHYDVVIYPSETLLYTLRGDALGLTGAKPGCENGDCGACTVLVDGIPMKSCMVLTAEVADQSILTVEGLVDSPIQKSFDENFAFQCGYCTPGFLMVSHGLLRDSDDTSPDRVREWLRSNICRCTSYQEIWDAVSSLTEQPGPSSPS